MIKFFNGLQELAQLHAPHASYIHAKTQYENIGDALIVGQLVDGLSQESTVVLSAKGIPAHFVNQIAESVRSEYTVLQSGKLAIFAALLIRRARGLSSAYALIPGGINGEKTVPEFLSGLVYNAALCLLAALGVSTLQLGISYDKLGPRHAMLIRLRAKALNHHYVRDRLTAEYCKTLGIRISGVSPDLAFRAFNERPAYERNPRFAFSFRTDRDGGELLHTIVSLIESSEITTDTDIVCVSQVSRDSDGMQKLCSLLKEKGYTRAEYVDISDSLQSAARMYEGCTTIYSNRLHALLFAAAQGCSPCPVLSENHDRKIAGIFLELGYSDLATTSAGDIRRLAKMDSSDAGEFWNRSLACKKELESCFRAIRNGQR